MPNLNVGLGLTTCLATNAWALDTLTQCMVSEGGTATLGCLYVTRTINCGTTLGTYTDCGTCAENYTRTERTAEISSTESYTYYTCARALITVVTCPTECTSESWTDNGDGKEIRCVKGTLSASCEYRCAAGYYGNGTTCTSCASLGDYNGLYGSSSAGSTSASSCCISSGSTYSFSDTAGSGTAQISSTCCAS
ncbi:MAG: hypothetical protein IJX43_04745 [Alphaproteobacteria bacterium]|nr:hypothetical protein [Alphaproteobacteria bacterium]